MICTVQKSCMFGKLKSESHTVCTIPFRITIKQDYYFTVSEGTMS